MAQLEFGLLGPLLVRRDRAEVPVPPGKQRAVLAALALAAGRVVPIDDLAGVLWGTEPPPSARVSVQNYVGRLRKALGPAGKGLIVTRPGGYQLAAGARQVDVSRFEALATGARAAGRRGAWAEAAGQAEAALALWRGEPLADAGSEALAAREGPRLGELRLQAAEARVEAQVMLGRPGEVIAELRQLAAGHPLREQLHGLLMLALYRDGRQAEALAAYQDARAVLVAELGTEPGAALSRLHQQILTADPALRPAAAGLVPGGAAPGTAGAAMRYSLPPDTAAFTGRAAELAAITATMAGTAGTGGVIAIRAIGGMPGAGKTALAVHAAHLLAGDFPDRQLFVSLHGHTPGREPVTPGDALAGLLAATGVDPRHLPGDLDGRAALWRDRMAGQRALLVLDNAASSAQVAPLLPGAGAAGGEGCLVLVTSRRHLGDLPGAVVPVLAGALPPGEAAQMFTRLAPRAAPYPDQVAEITRLAGHLPLAISLLARVHNRHPSWTLADLAAETRAGLLTLRAEDDSVAAAFGVSWRHLHPAAQRFFRLLALHPGTSADAFAAAALAAVPVADAAALLDTLHGEGLVTETAYRRYGLHDLLRRYARARAGDGPAGEAGHALGRLTDYYARGAARAQALLALQGRPVLPCAASPGPPAGPHVADAGQALSWARAERAGMLGCLDHAAREGQDARVIALTAGMAELLRRDGPPASAAARHQAAAEAARRLGERAAEAGALGDLGIERRRMGDYLAAISDVEQALGIFRDLGDRYGQASALTSLGNARWLTSDFPAAARDLGQALAISRDLGDRPGQARALWGLGTVRQLTGDYPAAARDLGQALAVSRDIRDRPGQARALLVIGDVRRLTGDYPAAARDLGQALAISRDLGDRLGQASALHILGDVRQLTGDYPAAGRDLGQALAISRDLGDRLSEGNALSVLGEVHGLAGDYPASARDLGRAFAIYRDLGNRVGEANTLSRLGTMRRLAGDYLAAARALDQALGIYRDLGDRSGEAGALKDRGDLYLAVGELAPAERCHQQARELARAVGSSWDEAGALAGLGRCALAGGRAADAGALLGDALEIFQRIGAAEASAVRGELDALATPRAAG